MQATEHQEPSRTGTASRSSGEAAERPFFFLHIRKTAGTSLRGLLANRFPADRILFKAHAVSGPQEPGDALFATGHVGFDYAERFKVWPTIFTVLREPLARCLSAYHFFQSHSEAFFRELSAELSADEYQSRRRFQELAQSQDPARFLAQEEELARHWLANVQTRQLAGTAFADLRDDDPRLLEAALDNLARIDLVGILERQADTLRLLAGMTGWGPLGLLPHLNRTPRSAGPAVDANSLDILRSWNELDLRLYAEACRLFDERLATLPPGDDTTKFGQPLGASGFTPDQPLHGFGWHERENHQGRWLCWNSAPAATLSLRAATARPARFCCLLSHVFNEEALDRLKITLNAQPLALRKRAVENGILLEGDIPSAAWTADPHRAFLTFRCPVMGRPRALDPSAADPRDLGFALAWLKLG